MFTGCATLRGTDQRIKVVTNPPDAEVYYKGSKLGSTPGFFEVPRAREATLTLKFPAGQEIHHSLKGKYRWSDSFTAGFIWGFIGAPVSWVIDLATHSAWEYEKIPTLDQTDQTYLGSADLLPSNRKKSIAIAPPQADFEITSDELGMHVQGITQDKFPDAFVADYLQTYPTFSNYLYKHTDPVVDLYRERLYFELGTTHIVETKTKKLSEGIQLSSELKNIYTDQVVEHFENFIPEKDLKTLKGGVLATLMSMVSIIPNTVFFDFTQSSLYFLFNTPASGTNFIPRSEKTDSPWSILTSIAFRNSRSPKLTEFRGVFRFITDLNFYYDRFHFDTPSPPNPLDGEKFTWLSLSIGFGPEVGIDTPMGYFYLDIVPSLAGSWISSSKNSDGRITLELDGEVGFSTFLSQRITLRLFAREISGSANQWNSILTGAAGQPMSIQSAFHGIFGLAIGYYFPESKNWVKKSFY